MSKNFKNKRMSLDSNKNSNLFVFKKTLNVTEEEVSATQN